MTKKPNKNRRGGGAQPNGSSVDVAASVELDPKLSALFNAPVPVHPPRGAHHDRPAKIEPSNGFSSHRPETTVLLTPDLASRKAYDQAKELGADTSNEFIASERPPRTRKRKRRDQEDDLEDQYMQRLAKDQRAVSSQAKKLRTEPGIADLSDASGNEDQVKPTSAEKATTATSDDESEKIPQHEALAARDDAADFEKAARTVFLGNVSTQAIKSKTARRTLLTHLVSFAASADSPPKVESLRFRSTAFATAAMPKKAAFATGHLMDATTQGTNAYAVYSTAASARDAVKKLNGSVVLGRHLRADSVAHPAPVDHRRCVFVGNLGFVDDESLIKASEDAEDEGTGKRKRRKKPSGDVEEGLWQQFGKAGAVESVRVVRDKSTRVGKGIAYVQFKDASAVERALLFNGQRFPPLLPRKLRVTRAKKPSKTTLRSEKNSRLRKATAEGKTAPQDSSMSGRAQKLLGRAAAASGRGQTRGAGPGKAIVKPESFVMEGHRAKAGRDKISVKPGRARSKVSRAMAKPRRTQRSVAFRTGKVSKGRA